MKLTKLLSAIVPFIFFSCEPTKAENKIPNCPLAIFTVNPTVTQVGTHPTLSWSIIYPEKVSGVAVISPTGTITLTKPCYVSVQPIGVGVTAYHKDMREAFIEARIDVNNTGYKQLFYGKMTDVQPQYSLYIQKLNSGNTINFGGRYCLDNKWGTFYSTSTTQAKIVTLVNGASIPTYTPVATKANFMTPYFDGSNKVQAGPMSVIVMMELGEENRLSSAFDYQDQALLVTFSTKHPNNGHGNNLDGIDSSNPANGSGGPNGAVDPSGTIDDEK